MHASVQLPFSILYSQESHGQGMTSPTVKMDYLTSLSIVKINLQVYPDAHLPGYSSPTITHNHGLRCQTNKRGKRNNSSVNQHSLLYFLFFPDVESMLHDPVPSVRPQPHGRCSQDMIQNKSFMNYYLVT